jgi:hypothetical protein
MRLIKKDDNIAEEEKENDREAEKEEVGKDEYVRGRGRMRKNMEEKSRRKK